MYAGDVITITASPLTAAYDTQAQIGGQAATVLELDRTDCAVCDACQEAAECSGCLRCEECVTSCESCTETVLVEVPLQLAPGPADLIVVNAYGNSEALTLEILPSPDAPSDTATPLDSGHTGHTGLTSGPAFWCSHDQTTDHPTRCNAERDKNSSASANAETVTFWTRIRTVVDHCLSLMY